MDEGDIFSVHAASDHEYVRKLFATINVGNSTVRFQLDSGATWNLLPAKYLEDGNELTPTTDHRRGCYASGSSAKERFCSAQG